MATFIGIAGLALSAVSSIQQSQQAEQQSGISAAFQGERAGEVEAQGELDAQQILSAGAGEEASFRKVADARRGSNLLNIARSGVMLEGSPLQVMNNIALETEKEALGIRFGSKKEAQDTKRQALLNAKAIRQGASSTIAEGQFASRKSLFTGGANLLQGAGSLFGSASKKISRPRASAPSGAFNPSSLAR